MKGSLLAALVATGAGALVAAAPAAAQASLEMSCPGQPGWFEQRERIGRTAYERGFRMGQEGERRYQSSGGGADRMNLSPGEGRPGNPRPMRPAEGRAGRPTPSRTGQNGRPPP